MAEAAGLVLALLPLLMSAAEHYKDICKPFLRYRKFSSEATRFQMELSIQRTKFRTEWWLLLSAVVGNDGATELLENAEHAGWSDGTVAAQLNKYLGDLKDSCINTISLIQQYLVILELEAKGLEKIIHDCTSVSSLRH